MRCPKCRESDEFAIEGAYQNLYTLYVDSKLESTDYKTGSIEWDKHAHTRCLMCGFEGPFDKFEGEEEE